MISIQSDADSLLSNSFINEHVKPSYERLTDSTSLSLFAIGTLSTLASREMDDSVRSQWRDHQKMSKDHAELGDQLGSGIPSLLILSGQYFVNSEWTPSHLRTLILSTTATSLMKVSFGRGRPGENSNHYSFPSGHTAISFATSTHLAMAYGWKVGAIAYPIAIFVAASRLSDDVHWFSDTMGGAVVGILSARATTFKSSQSGESVSSAGKWAVVPIVSSRQIGLTSLFQF